MSSVIEAQIEFRDVILKNKVNLIWLKEHTGLSFWDKKLKRDIILYKYQLKYSKQ